MRLGGNVSGRKQRERFVVTDSTVYVVGLLSSLGATVLAIVVGTLNAFTSFQVLASSLLVFVSGALVTLMVEVRRRSDRLGGILSITDRVASSSPAVIAYRQVGESLANIVERYPAKSVIDVAWQTAMRKCQFQLDNLGQGFLLVRSDDPTYKTELLNGGFSLRTTSLLKYDLSFWQSAEGQTYWQQQLAALRKGSLIERVFIYDVMTVEVRELIQEHADGGVVAYQVEESRLPLRDRVDIALWHDEVVFQQRVVRMPAITGPEFDRFCVERSEVDRALSQYVRIKGNPLTELVERQIAGTG